MPTVVLKPGREKSVLRRHPWIFSGAIQRADEQIPSGATVDVLSSSGDYLARAAYSPSSQIRLRVWTFADEAVDEALLQRRIRAALSARQKRGLALQTDAVRLIYAESDGLPGLIVDQYGEVLVMQCLTAGIEAWRDVLVDLLLKESGLSIVYERSDADVRELEGLQPRVGQLRGVLPAPLPPIKEFGLHFRVDLASGHKTGFYIDQRMNRQQVRDLAKGMQVLDCFSYTGGFSVNALAGGAESVLAVDSSAEALRIAQQNVELNGLPPDRLETLEGDVFQLLRKFRDERRSFDMVILDPPKFAPTAAQVERAARGYKDINLLALKLLRPGGLLVTFSCSGGVDAALFQKIVASAALDAGVDAQIIRHFSQSEDHPVSLHFPEGLYLKGLLCRKVT
jgi:23S rRNA (cytosine1962-C5)-methyltransferase